MGGPAGLALPFRLGLYPLNLKFRFEAKLPGARLAGRRREGGNNSPSLRAALDVKVLGVRRETGKE